ncbi:MAG: hypothetical protein AB7H66_07850 [Hyphomonadaceae bacterium]
MTKRRSSLTGGWSGAYRYPAIARAETVFNAQIEEVNGAFVGSTQEPNDFMPDAGAVLTADIEGVRDGGAVTFTKFYHHQGIRHAIRYEGAADEALMRIEGKWIVPPGWSGTFFMVRDDDGEAVEAEESADVGIEVRR